MSGGVAYVLDVRRFRQAVQHGDGRTGQADDAEETQEVRAMIQRHVEYTNSERGRNILKLWEEMAPKFVKVMPKDYRRVIEATQRVKAAGLSGEEAVMAAFEQNAHDLARVGGN